jgi:hypothetical protein
MNTENNHESNNLRIALGSAFVLVGITLVGTAVEIISRVQPIPWWAILLLVIGSLTLVIGLLILIVPPRHWKNIWHSVFGLPKWFRNACYWKCYGPKCTIGDPIFKPSEITEIGHDDFEAKISASVMIWIKTRGKPLRINLSSTNVCLEQKVGWDERETRFRLNTQQGIPEIILEPCKKWCDQILVSWTYHGKRDYFPNIQKRHRWGIWGISIALPRGNVKQLHKGAHCQPVDNAIRF